MRYIALMLLFLVFNLFWLGFETRDLVNDAKAGTKASVEIDENDFLSLLVDSAGARGKLERIDKEWKLGYAPALLEVLYFTRNHTTREQVLPILQKKIGAEGVYDLNGIYTRLWQQEIEFPSWYQSFKEKLYTKIDSRFAEYFKNTKGSLIRLDEIRWGGVVQNGIPPLRQPKMIKAEAASY